MKTLKREEIYATRYDNLEHMRANIEEFVERYYNRQRLHFSQKGTTAGLTRQKKFSWRRHARSPIADPWELSDFFGRRSPGGSPRHRLGSFLPGGLKKRNTCRNGTGNSSEKWQT